MIKVSDTDHLTIGRSGMPGQWFIKCRGKAYRNPDLAEAFNLAMWITPAMNLIERLQRHLAAGTIGTVRGGKSGISDDHTGMRFFCTFYCASPLTDTGDHGATFDAALAGALDKLDAKIGARLPFYDPNIAAAITAEAQKVLPSVVRDLASLVPKANGLLPLPQPTGLPAVNGLLPMPQQPGKTTDLLKLLPLPKGPTNV